MIFYASHGSLHQRIYHNFLEGGGHICHVPLLMSHLTFVEIIQNSRLNAAETEIIVTHLMASPGKGQGRLPCIQNLRLRKIHRFRISFPGSLIDLRPPGISKPYGARHFIKRFSRRIIPCPSEDLKLSVIPYNHQMSVSAGDDLTHKRRFQIRVFDVIGGNMPFDMMHANQRQLLRIGNRLGCRHTHEEGSHKPGAVGDSHRVDVIKSHPRFFQRQFDHLIDFFDVFAGRNLRNHTAVYGVKVDLRRNHIRENLPPVLYNGGGRLVTGTLNSQN